MRISHIIIGLIVFGFTGLAAAQQHNIVTAESDVPPVPEEEVKAANEGGFEPGEMILHHVSDAHSIHFIGHLSMPLPVIIYTDKGLDVFMSSVFWDGNHETTKIYEASSGNKYVLHHEKIAFADEHSHGTSENHPEGAGVHGRMLIDLSITKSVFGMLVIMIVMVLFFTRVASKYRKGVSAPSGAQGLIEPLILFIRDEVAVPSIGAKKAHKFMPFLLTVFFFIWMCNLLGLIPFAGGFNITGTLAITAVLSTAVFVITTVNGNGHYWGHILWPPGVPLPIKFVLVPIEIIGIFIKPLILMVRLTANITAGHIIILAFVSLVIMFGQSSVVAGYGVGVGAVVFMILMFFIELLVAFLQAYVFTLLAALYFGDATHEVHHH